LYGQKTEEDDGGDVELSSDNESIKTTPVEMGFSDGEIYGSAQNPIEVKDSSSDESGDESDGAMRIAEDFAMMAL
jgi:hypothetical protein